MIGNPSPSYPIINILPLQVDYQVQADGTVTLRERDSMAQVRVPVTEIATVVRSLVDGATSWDEVQAKYPAQKTAGDEATA